jgi:hypothetical protein
MSSLEFYKMLIERRAWAASSPAAVQVAFTTAINDFERTEHGALCKMVVVAEAYVEALCINPASVGKGVDHEKHLDELRVSYETQQGALRSWDTE